MQPMFGAALLESIPDVYDWLHAHVLNRTGKQLQRLHTQAQAAAQAQQVPSCRYAALLCICSDVSS